MEHDTVEHVLALLQERPEDIQLYQRLGHAYLCRGDIRAALEAYMQALRLDPK